VIGLDTNVLVRYVVRDDPGQTALADQVIDALDERETAFLSLVVLVELWWVLRRTYRFERGDCIRVVAGLVASSQLVVEDAAAVRAAIELAERGADLADALVVESARRIGCTEVVTFDRGAVRQAGMRLLA
jgi:predicted nucleic-acid-binding protein